MKATKQREIPAALKPGIFAKISRRWPAIKWIKMLLEPDPSIDKWMAAVLRKFAGQKGVCCNKCKWAFIHIIRIAGEKKLAVVVDDLIKIHDCYREEWDSALVDSALVALEEIGPPAFDSVFKAFAGAKEADVKTTYLDILGRLGVRDEKLKGALIECYDLDPPYVAGSIGDYGDKALLPFLYERAEAAVSILKNQISASRKGTDKTYLYIELREAIVDLEQGRPITHVPPPLIDYYERKGKITRTSDLKQDEEYALFEEASRKLDRLFFGYDVDWLPAGDDELDDNDGRSQMDIGTPYKRDNPKIGRNDPCPCGSGKKFKKCCFEKLH